MSLLVKNSDTSCMFKTSAEYSYETERLGYSELAQQVKVAVAKPGDFSSLPRIHRLGENHGSCPLTATSTAHCGNYVVDTSTLSQMHK